MVEGERCICRHDDWFNAFGERCICRHDDWFNAFGETTNAVHTGMRLTVVASKRIGGATFYAFKETPEDNFFLSTGFKPMRNLQ